MNRNPLEYSRSEQTKARGRNRAMRIHIAGIAASALLTSSTLLSGCASSGSGAPARATLHQTSPQTARANVQQPAPPPAQPHTHTPAAASAPSQPIARPAPLRTARVGADLIAGMSVPYDNMSLPLVSPDGRFVATQTRIGPDWPTILAEREASVPYATHIEIYEIPSQVPSDGYPEPIFVAEVDEPALLGRSFDDFGFLIEAPQEDGSRWIGYVAWETGEVTWLVADEYVNTFAALGPDDRIAWCRRDVDAEDDAMFDLVIRNGEHEWTVETSARRRESWLMPTWTWQGDGLFVLSLTNRHLEAVYADARDASAFRQSRHRLPLAIEASVFSAYQTIGAQTCGPGSAGFRATEQPTFIFFHPSQMRMAMWRPGSGASPRSSLTVLDRLSYAAVLHDADHALLTTETGLLMRRLSNERERSEVIYGMNVVRPTPRNAEWPYVLVAPEDGRVGVIPMRPLQPRDLANR